MKWRGRPRDLLSMLPGLRRVLARFWPYMHQHLPLLGAAFVALFVSVGARLLEPWPLKFVIDRVVVVSPGHQGSGIGAIDALEPLTLLAWSATALLLIVALRGVGNYLSTVGFALVGTRMLTKIREDLYRHLHSLPLAFHAKARTGDLTIRIISDIGMLKEATVTAILPMLASVLVLAGMIAVMLWMNWQLALIALSPLPLLWLNSANTGRRIQAVSREQRQREGAMAATAAESMSGIRDVQALSLAPVFERSFTSESGRSLKEGVKAKRLAAALQRNVDVLIGLSLALALWFGARLVLEGTLTPGDLLVFMTYLKNTFRPIRAFAKYTSRLAKATAAAERVLELLDEPEGIRDRHDARNAPPFSGQITFDQVSFEYEADKGVLRDVSLEIQSGEKLAIVGPSGSGKSTLVSLLLRLHDPKQGRVLVDGVDIREYRLAALRAQISIVPSDTVLFAVSVLDNIRFGCLDASREEVEHAAVAANAHEFISGLPEGYATMLGERGVTLSSGQRQRIAIARAVLRGSPVLILDEPTAALDETNKHTVIEALGRLTQRRTVVMITHDPELAQGADRIAYLRDGRLVEHGSHRELMLRNGPYAAGLSGRALGLA